MTNAAKSQSFVKNVSLTFGTRIILAGFQFFFRIGIAILLGPTDQGTFFWFLQTTLVLSTFVNMGICASAVFFLPKEQDNQRPIISTLTIGSLLSPLFWTIAGILILKVFFPLYDTPVSLQIIIAGVISAELILTGYNTLLGTSRSTIYNVITLVQVLLQFIFLIILYFALQNKLSAAIHSYVISSILTVIITAIVVFSKHPIKFSLSMNLTKKLVLFSFSSWLPSIFYLLNLRFGFYAIQHYLGSNSSGIYSLSLMIAELLWFVPDSISTILLPKLSGSTSNELKRDFGNSICRITVIISLFISIPLILGGSGIYLLFNNYRESLFPFLLLIPGTFAFSICKIISSLIISNGKLAITNISSIIMIAINVCGCLILIPLFGINGAAITTTVAYIAGTLIAAAYYARISKSTISSFIVPTKSDFSKLISLVRKFVKCS